VCNIYIYDLIAILILFTAGPGNPKRDPRFRVPVGPCRTLAATHRHLLDTYGELQGAG